MGDQKGSKASKASTNTKILKNIENQTIILVNCKGRKDPKTATKVLKELRAIRWVKGWKNIHLQGSIATTSPRALVISRKGPKTDHSKNKSVTFSLVKIKKKNLDKT